MWQMLVMVGALATIEDPPPNVLMVIVDDLAPRLGCYGDPLASTPALDGLAEEGQVFLAAYCQSAMCSPSRTSLLTGLRPDTTKVFNLVTHFRETLPNAVTLPQHFQRHGYAAAAVGKVFHDQRLNDPESWSLPWIKAEGEKYQNPANRKKSDEAEGSQRSGPRSVKEKRAIRGPSTEAENADDAKQRDHWVTDRALQRLEELHQAPFFLAVGLSSPHLPLTSPQSYWDRYDPEKFSAPKPPGPAKKAPAIASHSMPELRSYPDLPLRGPIPPEDLRRLMHGYLATVSFVDAQIGRLLEALEEHGIADHTIVVVTSDHGMHLGEHGLFGKQTNYEVALRVPLILRVPGQSPSRIEGMVELVDLFPTLCQLASLDQPKDLEGIGFLPLLQEPDRVWKAGVLSQIIRNNGGGYSLLTPEHHLVVWEDKGKELIELYDRTRDPRETRNVARREDQATTLEALRQRMRIGWRGLMPLGRPGN